MAGLTMSTHRRPCSQPIARRPDFAGLEHMHGRIYTAASSMDHDLEAMARFPRVVP
jgi:hypothetical protein